MRAGYTSSFSTKDSESGIMLDSKKGAKNLFSFDVNHKPNSITMRRHFYLFLIILVLPFYGYSQGSNIREDVFIHVNTKSLLVGETLQYTAFSLSRSTNKISPLSKFVYVELVGKEGVVYRKKHALNQGQGHGELFIPSHLNTGSYYLLAYTRWMKNFEDFAKSPLVIVNPYKGYEKIPSPDKQDISMTFAPLAGKIANGMKNKIAFQIKGSLNQTANDKGRLVDNSGKQLQELSWDQNGIGSFEFTPESGKDYQVILSDPNGQFSFFDLPNATSKRNGIFVEHSDGFLQIHLGTSLGKLKISHGDTEVFQKDINGSFPIKINRQDLPTDLLEITTWSTAGDLISTYHLSNNKPNVKPLSTSFGTREAVSIQEQLKPGKYSISVRKSFNMEKTKQHAIYSKILRSDEFVTPDIVDFGHLENWAALFGKKKSGTTVRSITYLPEYRGELMHGRITSKNGTTVQDKAVLLAIPNTSLNISGDLTDRVGNFSIEYETLNGEDLEAYVTVYDFADEYEIHLEDNFLATVPLLDFPPISLDSGFVEEITDRSIYSQLQNAYYSPDRDTSAASVIPLPILAFDDFEWHYELDDYTRFRTMKEHFVEYISRAGVVEKEINPFTLIPTSSPVDERIFEVPPLIVLDGVPVSGKEILAFSPYRIKSVHLLPERFFMNDFLFGGVLRFDSFEGSMGGFEALRNTLKINLAGASMANQNLINIDAEKIRNRRIPDQRIQLLWLPTLDVSEEGIQSVDFYTSDIEGDFELVIEGITDNGSPVSMIRKFNVKNTQDEKQ